MPSFPHLPCCTKVLTVSQGPLQGDEGWRRFRTPPGASSPDPAAPKGRALSPDLLLQGPLCGTTLGRLFKMQISEPSPVGPTPLFSPGSPVTAVP